MAFNSSLGWVSKEAAPPLYPCLNVTIHLSCNVSFIIKFFVGRRWRHGFYMMGALQVICICGFWKGDHDLHQCLIVTIHLSCTVSDIIKFFISRKWIHGIFFTRGRCRWFIILIWNGDPEFISVGLFNCNTRISCTISDMIKCLINRKWCHGVFSAWWHCRTGDVYLRILKGRPRLNISV